MKSDNENSDGWSFDEPNDKKDSQSNNLNENNS